MGKLQKYQITYEIGDPDYGCVVRMVGETMAVSLSRTISNIWYRTGRNATFFVVGVVEG